MSFLDGVLEKAQGKHPRGVRRQHEQTGNRSDKQKGAFKMLGALGHKRAGFADRVKHFQEHHGLAATGKLDDQTYAAIRQQHSDLKAGKRGPWDPKQHPRQNAGNPTGGQFVRKDALTTADTPPDLETVDGPSADSKECPKCGESVPTKAKRCPNCGYEFGVAKSTGLRGMHLGDLTKDAADVPNKPGVTNWVEQHGNLPKYIADIAGDLITQRGMTTSRAIATAVSRCKVWCAGGQHVTAVTKAKACDAIAQWEKMKAAANVSKSVAIRPTEAEVERIVGPATMRELEEGVRLMKTREDVSQYVRTSASGRVVHVSSYHRNVLTKLIGELQAGQTIKLPDGRSVKLGSDGNLQVSHPTTRGGERSTRVTSHSTAGAAATAIRSASAKSDHPKSLGGQQHFPSPRAAERADRAASRTPATAEAMPGGRRSSGSLRHGPPSGVRGTRSRRSSSTDHVHSTEAVTRASDLQEGDRIETRQGNVGKVIATDGSHVTVHWSAGPERGHEVRFATSNLNRRLKPTSRGGAGYKATRGTSRPQTSREARANTEPTRSGRPQHGLSQGDRVVGPETLGRQTDLTVPGTVDRVDEQHVHIAYDNGSNQLSSHREIQQQLDSGRLSRGPGVSLHDLSDSALRERIARGDHAAEARAELERRHHENEAKAKRGEFAVGQTVEYPLGQTRHPATGEITKVEGDKVTVKDGLGTEHEVPKSDVKPKMRAHPQSPGQRLLSDLGYGRTKPSVAKIKRLPEEEQKVFLEGVARRAASSTFGSNREFRAWEAYKNRLRRAGLEIPHAPVNPPPAFQD